MPSIRPKKKLKNLHWEKIDTPQVTVWATRTPTHEEKEKKYTELAKKGVLDEVERLFMAKETKILGGGPSAKQRKDKKQIISNDLSKNFQIALAKFSHVPVDQVVRMIIQCDNEILDNNVVMDFLQRDDLCNIPENTAKLMAPYAKDWTVPDAATTEREQDINELTREDQIYLQTAYELHHYWKSRMRALALTRSYEPDYDYLSSKIQEVVKVCDSLRDSVSLMNVLGLILDIGNYMNDANKQAQGFKLSSLARLGMVKDDKNETTFADLVERIVRNQYPEWEGFQEEIGGVLNVYKVNVDQLQQDAKKYIETIRNVQMSLDSGNLSDPKKFHPQDRVSQVVQRCMKEARRKAEQMQIFLDDLTKTYDDIMTFYGEDTTDENARRDFFSKLANFLIEWKVLFPLFSILPFSKQWKLTRSRNQGRRISRWRRPGNGQRLRWLASEPPTLPSPMVGLATATLKQPAGRWIPCWRSFGRLRRRREISAIAVVVLGSKNDIRCGWPPDKRCPTCMAWAAMAQKTKPQHRQKTEMATGSVRKARRIRDRGTHPSRMEKTLPTVRRICCKGCGTTPKTTRSAHGDGAKMPKRNDEHGGKECGRAAEWRAVVRTAPTVLLLRSLHRPRSPRTTRTIRPSRRHRRQRRSRHRRSSCRRILPKEQHELFVNVHKCDFLMYALCTPWCCLTCIRLHWSIFSTYARGTSLYIIDSFPVTLFVHNEVMSVYSSALSNMLARPLPL